MTPLIALLFVVEAIVHCTVAFSLPPSSRQCTLPSFLETTEPIPRSRSTTLFSLGRNYLDTIDNNNSNDDNNSRNSNNGNNNRWNFGSKQQGVGTAVVRSEANQKQYGIGGGNSWGKQQQGRAKIVPIKQPQDLLDFVIEDERLSVVKVYATWCKTCQVFDIRYRKLASQIGDIYSSSSPDALLQKGRVRFSEMAFDDPNNEEMCRLLNATKLPYILVYKGSRGKITDFQCGPSNFQMLIDVVNQYADPAVAGADGRGQALMVIEDDVGEQTEEEGQEEQEWRVLQEQEQEQRRLSAREEQSMKVKDEEIARLYKELSNLRKEYDKKIQSIKEEHGYETGQLREEMERQTKQYEEERAALSAQIKQLTQDMIEREKAYRAGEDATSNQLRRDLKDKEREYENTLTGLNYRISSLEEELFKTKNELKYNSEASEREKEEMAATIALLEEEQQNLLSRNKELERELIEDKLLVVQTTEEASRVLKQLEAMRTGKEEEAAKLMARIRELEAEISRLQTDIDGGYDMSREMERLKAEFQQERELMAARIIELESSQGEWQPGGLMELQQERERVVELEQTIESIKAELTQRDRLLRTSNKATDILLDQMEAQKRAYEKELERTAELTNELEEAITKRELELRELQAQFSSLERIAEGLKARDMRRMREELNDVQGGMENERWKMERELRLSAEQEVTELRELLNQRREGQNVAGNTSSESKPKKSFFEQMFGARDGGSWDGGFGDGLGFGRSQESMIESTMSFATSQETKGDYELLNDVLAPDEVSPREGIPGWVGSSKTENARNAAGFYTPSPSVVNEVPVRVPTPQLEFERRLAENPIVPAGAFGASRPTAPFFRSSNPPTMDFSSSDRSKSVDQQYQMPSDSSDGNAPTLPPGTSFSPRPTSPTPRVRARTGITDNIYAGAGSAAISTPPSPAVPSPTVYEEPAQVPTPQLEFERRLAENPIVPAGAFGGSKPTANFFRKTAAPSPPPRQSGSRNINEDDTQSKWQSLDEAEKKRVAAEAYKAFEKQLADRRSQEQKPKQGAGVSGGRGPQIIVNPARSTLQDDSKGAGADRRPPAENPARTTVQKQKENQLQLERKKHQEMVEQASGAQQKQQDNRSTSQKHTNESERENEKLQQKKIETSQVGDADQTQQNQTAQELRRTAADASTKRAKKAQDASQTELKRQNQMKAEAIRREQSERRAREEAILRQRQVEEQKRKTNDEKARAANINAEKEAAEMQKLSEEQKNRKISQVKASAEEQKLLMEKQRRKAGEAKERERELKAEALARAKAEGEDRALVERHTSQVMKEQLEAESRAKAVEEKLRIEEDRMKVKAGDLKKVAVSQLIPPAQRSQPSGGSQQPVQNRVAQGVKLQQQAASKPLRDLADSGKRLRDLAGSAGNEAKYKVVVLKEGNKSELEGPLKDLLSAPKEATTRKNDNY
eukprot:CCRYP_007249-RA/>CCRYP_007249-RA protein AED:0.25 eAED:0.25 QI:211/0.85/0.87/1/1/1/8/367/1439